MTASTAPPRPPRVEYLTSDHDGQWHAFGEPSVQRSTPRGGDASKKGAPCTDGHVFDVVLQEHMRWSDGIPITLSDDLIAYELEANPDTGGNLFPQWYVDGKPVTVEPTGPWSLRIALPGPDREALGTLLAQLDLAAAGA